ALIVGDQIAVSGTLSSEKNKVYHIELYNNVKNDGQGKIFITSFDVTTDANGNATWSVNIPKTSTLAFLTATATDPDNNTSEFSGATAVQVTPITGTVFTDLNCNGKKDGNETGIANWRVYLDANNNGKLDAGEKSVLTNTAGQYTFTGLKVGTY